SFAELVEGAAEAACGLARAGRERDVADAIARAARQQSRERVGHRALETGDGGHAGEADGEAVDVLPNQSDGRTDGQEEAEREPQPSHESLSPRMRASPAQAALPSAPALRRPAAATGAPPRARERRAWRHWPPAAPPAATARRTP